MVACTCGVIYVRLDMGVSIRWVGDGLVGPWWCIVWVIHETIHVCLCDVCNMDAQTQVGRVSAYQVL